MGRHCLTSGLRIALCLFVLAVLFGCGGGGGGGQDGGNVEPASGGGAVLSQEATIVISSVLERSVPREVDQIRLTGFDAGGLVRYGPASRPKAASVTFAQVPLSVRRVQVEYLVGGRVLGIAIASVELVANTVTQLSDLNFATVEARLEGLSIEPASIRLAKGTSAQLRAVGRYEDGSVLDLTGSVDWSVAGNSIAVETPGMVEAVNVGRGQARAAFGSFTASASVEVTAATINELRISPTTASIPLGTEQGYSVVGTFSDGSSQDLTAVVDFSLSHSEVATPTANSGQFRSTGVGETTVTVSYLGRTASGTLKVTEAVLTRLEVSPAVVQLAKGESTRLFAEGSYSDGTAIDLTEVVHWTSDSPQVCDVDPEGRLRGLAEGSATVTASVGDLSAELAVEVSPAAVVSLAVEPSSLSVTAGEQRPLIVTARFTDQNEVDVTSGAVFVSNSPEIVGVSTLENRGVVTGVAPGTSIITVTFGGKTVEVAVEVTPRPTGDLVIGLTLVQARSIDAVISTFKLHLVPVGAPTPPSRSYPRATSGTSQQLFWTGLPVGNYAMKLEMFDTQGALRGTFQRYLTIVAGETTYIDDPSWDDTPLELPPSQDPIDLKSIRALSGFGALQSLAYDRTRGRVYLSSSGGNRVLVYSLATKSFLAPIEIGPTPWGLDLSPDDSKLVVALSGTNKVATIDLTADPLTYVTADVPASTNNRPLNLAVAADGKAFFGCKFGGSGWTDLHELDLATNTIVRRTGFRGSSSNRVSDPLYLAASGDRKKVILAEGNIGSGPIFLYDSVTHSFEPARNTSGFMRRASANADGTLFEVNSGIFNSRLQKVQATNNTAGGFCFSSRPGIAYRGSASLEILDTERHLVAERISLPTAITGPMVCDSTGRRVIAIAGSSILDIELANRPPHLPAQETTVVPVGRSASVILHPVDPDHDSVSLSPVQLPNGASFDAASRTLKFAPTAPTNEAVTATFLLDDGTTRRTASIRLQAVEDSPVTFLPTAGTLSELALDDATGVLYASNNTQNRVERLDVSNLTFVTPLATDDGPRGLDLDATGGRLVVCAGRSQFVDTFDLSTFARRQSPYTSGVSSYPLDVAVGANNIALLTYGFIGSGAGFHVAQFRLDTGEVIPRPDTPMVEHGARLSASRDRSTIGISAGYQQPLIYESSGGTFRSLSIGLSENTRLTLNSDGSLGALLDGPRIIDVNTGGILATGQGYEQLSFVDSNQAVAHSYTQTLDRIRLDNFQVVERYHLPQPASSGPIVVSADGQRAYVICEGGVAVVDL